MAKYKQINEDGTETEIEAFTSEEVDAKIAEKENEFNTKIAEKDTTLSALASEKAKLEADIAKAKLEGIKEDHPNFKILKDALDKKDEAISGLKTEIDTDRKTRKEEAMSNEIKKISKGNEEFEKKVKFHLEKTVAALPDSTPEERQVKLAAAVKLSDDGGGQGMFDSGTGGGSQGGNGGGAESTRVEFTSREKGLGKKLGITDEDYKKYGSRVSKR